MRINSSTLPKKTHQIKIYLLKCRKVSVSIVNFVQIGASVPSTPFEMTTCADWLTHALPLRFLFFHCCSIVIDDNRNNKIFSLLEALHVLADKIECRDISFAPGKACAVERVAQRRRLRQINAKA